MFKKILIANRGEIACRVAATARRLGVRTVAVYSDADSRAKHVQACDEAVGLGGNTAQESYLQWQRILEAARETGADAIHPGYGFLSENAAFAQACAEAGVVFIGPRPESIQAMGLKSESKRLMAQAGVPLVPGYHGADQDAALLQREADRLGYPVLIKASAGGGGRGMRVVDVPPDFHPSLEACRREARNSFGNDAVLIEKYVQRPRHIEIQVFGDVFGQVIHLFERDCSVQRRHQKVLEESPAPGMTPALRASMGAAAVAAAKAVNYVGAGTVEFIVEQATYGDASSMAFYFMEMNTRLQVEHPVTEAVTGLDLVEWQLRVACGEPLPRCQDDVALRGHAIEARICAENPDQDFLPSIGTLHVYRKPASAAFSPGPVRYDDGVREGDAISPYYDSMLAKVIAHGDTREQALARLDAALAQTRIVGLNTNVQFLRRVVQSRAFVQARLDTALIAREAAALFGVESVPCDEAVALAVAHLLHAEVGLATANPFGWRDGWQAFGETRRRFDFDSHAGLRQAWLTYSRQGLVLQIGDSPARTLAFEADAAGGLRVSHGAQQLRGHIHWLDGAAHLFTPGGAVQLRWLDPLAHVGEDGEAGGGLSAPLPGRVVSVAVAVGAEVRAGQALAVIEAMKMEHTLVAPCAGRVTDVRCVAGEQVAEGVELFKIEAP